ncbi:MAG: aldehyde dehydrogenase family protein [Candidatus Peribacteria bacterium]|nr:MAG: aldehyde dehydrogenase family protein [Candidatus Peribacteria bacterium]
MSQQILTGTANLIRRYANHAEEILGSTPFSGDGLTGVYQYDPLGVIYGIAPRNFPYNQVLRAACANIMAGNTTVYKHASNVPMCAAMIQEIFEKS